MQDLVAIAVAVAAGAWIVRTLWRQLAAPACGQRPAQPGADGFVPLDDLVRRPHKVSGRKGSGRP
jgi:hypothetical protein